VESTVDINKKLISLSNTESYKSDSGVGDVLED
jgi:uncharacterized protein YutE (UPF0331/DUF86 family)